MVLIVLYYLRDIIHGLQDVFTMELFLQVTIIPRMGEEKGAVRFKTDRTKFELQSIRFSYYPSHAVCGDIV